MNSTEPPIAAFGRSGGSDREPGVEEERREGASNPLSLVAISYRSSRSKPPVKASPDSKESEA